MNKFNAKLIIAWVTTLVLVAMTLLMIAQNLLEQTIIQYNRYMLYLFFYVVFITDFIETLSKRGQEGNPDR